MHRSEAEPPAAPPPRPSALEERFSFPHFRLFSPRVPRIEQPSPPPALRPYEVVGVPRPDGRRGTLEGTWFPSRTEAVRGAVLLLPPWLQWGRSYFHRRGRIAALRQAGYHVLTLDFPGFAGSAAAGAFFDLDVTAGLDELARRVPGLPLYVWGVSAGGHWAHQAIARDPRARAAFFEDVSPHLLEWGWREVPIARPGYFLLRMIYPRTYRFLDIRRHAPALRGRPVAYVSGELDRGVPPGDTRDLAHLAGAQARIVPGAGHLEAIKVANHEVISLALETFAAAEASERSSKPPEDRAGASQGIEELGG